MLNKKYDFLTLAEGVVKFNLIFFLTAIISIFYGYMSSERLYHIYEEQFVIIVVSLFCGKIYQYLNGYKFRNMEIKLSSLLLGYTIYVGFYLLLHYLFSNLDDDLLKSRIVSLLAGYVFWLTCTFLAKSNFMSKIIRFLHGTLEYKNLFHLFLMFNLAFLVMIIVMLSVGMLAGRSLFESIFVILYFEIAFIIFHIVIAKAVDYIWDANLLNQNKVSVLGLYCGAIFYIIKVNIISENVLGIISIESDVSLFALLALLLFWTFFIILFHFELRYPIKRR